MRQWGQQKQHKSAGGTEQLVQSELTVIILDESKKTRSANDDVLRTQIC